jgi:hypothetical protein
VLYVIDGPALITLSLGVDDASDILTEMGELIENGTLCFCPEVLAELDRLAKGDMVVAWAHAAAPNRVHKGAAYSVSAWVVHDFPAITDTTARHTQESAAPYVVAQALELREAGQDVTIVSEDRRPKPTRASVLAACEHFEIKCITLHDFLVGVGLVDADEDAYYEDDFDDDD